MSNQTEYQIINPIMIKLEQADDWKQHIEKNLPQRKHYLIEHQTYNFGQVSAIFLGAHLVEDEYLNMLYEITNNSLLKLNLLSQDRLNKHIEGDVFQALQKILMHSQKENGLSPNRFVAFLDAEQLIPRIKDPILNRHIRKQLIELLKQFIAIHPNKFADPSFKRIMIDLIKWMKNHFEEWVKHISIDQEFPKVLWYGDASKSQSYFLYYLMKIGCDVIIYHPSGLNIFKQYDLEHQTVFIHTYTSTMEIRAIPTHLHETRKSTVAYRASKEIDTVLHHDDSSLHKPWQFRNYTPHSVTLKTTYDELYILINEKAYLRPGFKVENQKVYIPSFFTKINGVSKNRKEYWVKLQALCEGELSLNIKNFPFTTEGNSNFIYHYQHALQQDGTLDPQKIKTANWWSYNYLSTGLQEAIASAISRYCDNPRLLPKSNEKIEDVKLYLFAQASEIPKDVLQLLQKFDYSQDVPKLILYNNEQNGLMSRSDASLLLLLNEIGLDIVVFNPPGHNDLENYIEQKYIDKHWLEDVVFEQDFKEPSLHKMLTSKIKNLFKE